MGSRHETKPGPALNQNFIITQDAICLALPVMTQNKQRTCVCNRITPTEGRATHFFIKVLATRNVPELLANTQVS